MHLQGIIIKKQNDMLNQTLDSTADKPEKILTLSDTELPEIKNWDINKKYTITLNVIQKTKNSEGEDGVTADFKILKVTPGSSSSNAVSDKNQKPDDNEEGDEEINYSDYENMDDAMLNSKPMKSK